MKKHKGISLVLTLIVMTIVAMLSGFIISRSTLTYKIYKNDYFSKQAFYLAQSGIYYARAYLKTINWYTNLIYSTSINYDDETTWPQLIPSSGTYYSIDGNKIRVIYYYNPSILSKDVVIIRSYGITKSGALKEIEAKLTK